MKKYLFIIAMFALALSVCPDGTYVNGTPQTAPDGSYVGGKPQTAPDGSYVGSEK